MYPGQPVGPADLLNASPFHNLLRVYVAPQGERAASSEMTQRTLTCHVKSLLPSVNMGLKTKNKYSYDKTKSSPYWALLSLWPEKFELATKLYIIQLILKTGFYFILPE